jgi:hypothetical protein
MSTDYSTGKPTRFPNVTAAAGVVAGSYIFGEYDFLALNMVLRVGAVSSAAATINLEVSDVTGNAGWTTIGSLVVPSGSVIGTIIQSRVPDNVAFVSVSSTLSPGTTGARRCLRLNQTGAGTALIYDLEVYTTSRHE